MNYVGNYLKAGPSNTQKIATFDDLNALTGRQPVNFRLTQLARSMPFAPSIPLPLRIQPNAAHTHHPRQLGLPRFTFQTDNTPLLPANQADNYTWPQPHRNQHVVNQ